MMLGYPITDLDQLEALVRLAHTPVLETDAGVFFEAGLPNNWRTMTDMDDLDPQMVSAIEWAESEQQACHCGWRGSGSNIHHGTHLERMIRLAREGRIELP